MEPVWSSEFSIHGIPWKINVKKNQQDAEQCLDVYLNCANKDKSPNWSLAGTMSPKLLPFSSNANPIEYRNNPYVFDASAVGFGTDSLIKWIDLFDQDKKCVKDDISIWKSKSRRKIQMTRIEAD